MSAIQNLQEAWNGHTNQEVEDFLKTKIQVVKFFRNGSTLENPQLENGEALSSETLLSMVLSGPVYAIIGDNFPYPIRGYLLYDSNNDSRGIYCMSVSGFGYRYSLAGDCCGGCC